MKKTRKTFTIIILKKAVMLILSVVLLTAALPVTTTKAKKLGKVPMGYAPEHSGLWGQDDSVVDFPRPFFDDWGIDHDLNCKPGDTFTFIMDNDELNYKIEAYNRRINTKTDGKLIWHSTDPDVATVNNKGKVTVKSEGNAAITACIKVTSKGILGGEWTTEEYVLYRHWIHSGPVLQLKKGNVKAVARNAHKIIKRDRFPIVRAKGSSEETKELFQSFVKEYNKLGHNGTSEIVQEIGNFTYWW